LLGRHAADLQAIARVTTMALTAPMFLVRILFALAVATFCLSMSFATGFVALMVMGQAQLTMAYFYQYKAGKVDRAYVIRFSAMFAALLVGVLWLDWGPGVHFLAAGYFVVHFLYDERHLVEDGDDFGGWLRLLPIALIFLAMVVRNRLGFDAQFEAGVVAVAGVAVWTLGMAFRGRRPAAGGRTSGTPGSSASSRSEC
jgi:hypothetical protein